MLSVPVPTVDPASAQVAGNLKEEGAIPEDPHARFFSTDHLRKDIKGRSVRGGLITVAGKLARLVLQLGSTAVLARLLSPEDFGLIAMVTVFTGMVGLFKDFGLSMATVQKAEIDHRQVSSMFWINVALSLLLALVTLALAPLVGWFYGRGELVMITMVVGCGFIFGGLSAQHVALLRRQMRFTTLAAIDLSVFAISVLIAVAIAWLGGGYWSLVSLPLTQSLFTAVFSFTFSGWIPGRPGFGEDVKAMVRFGRNLTGFSVVNYLTRNSDNLLIGRFVGAGPLGLYTKAYGLLLLPLQQINGPVGAVVVPALSRLQDDPKQYRQYYLKGVQTVAYATMPMVVLLGVLAEDAIRIVLGPGWQEATPIFRIFAVCGFWQAVTSTTGWVLVSLGQTGRMFKWGLFQSVVAVLAFMAGLPWGVIGVATAATMQAFLIAIPQLNFAYRYSPIRTSEVFKVLIRPLMLSGLLLLVTVPIFHLLMEGPMLTRIAAVLSVAAVLALATFGLCRPCREDFQSVWRLLRRKNGGS